MIIKEGQVAVCAESLAARRVDKRHQRNNTEEYAEAAKYWQEVIRNRDSQRTRQNKKIYIDDNGHPVPDNIVVYKDVHQYKQLYKGMYFGGRSLLADFRKKFVERQLHREKGAVR